MAAAAHAALCLASPSAVSAWWVVSGIIAQSASSARTLLCHELCNVHEVTHERLVALVHLAELREPAAILGDDQEVDRRLCVHSKGGRQAGSCVRPCKRPRQVLSCTSACGAVCCMLHAAVLLDTVLRQVAWHLRADVAEGHCLLVLINDGGWDLLGNDLVKQRGAVAVSQPASGDAAVALVQLRKALPWRHACATAGCKAGMRWRRRALLPPLLPPSEPTHFAAAAAASCSEAIALTDELLAVADGRAGRMRLLDEWASECSSSEDRCAAASIAPLHWRPQHP